MPDELSKLMLESAATLLGAQQVQAKKVREQSKEAYGKLLEANFLVVGAIASAILRVQGKFGELHGEAERRAGIIAGIVSGIHICELAITEGHYVQASALVRQELEGIAALEELQVGLRRERKTPNVSHVPWQLGRLYDELSQATHLADHVMIKSLLKLRGAVQGAPEHSIVWRLTPQLDPGAARRLYGVHTALLIQLAEHINTQHEALHNEGLNENEAQAVIGSFNILMSEGILVEDAP